MFNPNDTSAPAARWREMNTATLQNTCAGQEYPDAPIPPAPLLLVMRTNDWTSIYDAALLARADKSDPAAQAWGRAFVEGYADSIRRREVGVLIMLARSVEGYTWREGDPGVSKWTPERYADVARSYWAACDELRVSAPIVPEIVLRAVGGASYRALLAVAEGVKGRAAKQARPSDPIVVWAESFIKADSAARDNRRAVAAGEITRAAYGRRLAVRQEYADGFAQPGSETVLNVSAVP